MHVAELVAPTVVLYVPTTHFVHAEEPAPLYVPATHETQVDGEEAPVALLEVPAAH
jgi:hypothetical protein